jgi:hypothetical protein
VLALKSIGSGDVGNEREASKEREGECVIWARRINNRRAGAEGRWRGGGESGGVGSDL